MPVGDPNQVVGIGISSLTIPRFVGLTLLERHTILPLAEQAGFEAGRAHDPCAATASRLAFQSRPKRISRALRAERHRHGVTERRADGSIRRVSPTISEFKRSKTR